MNITKRCYFALSDKTILGYLIYTSNIAITSLKGEGIAYGRGYIYWHRLSILIIPIERSFIKLTIYYAFIIFSNPI